MRYLGRMKKYFFGVFLLIFLISFHAKGQTTNKITSVPEDVILDHADVMPEFPGGEDSMMAFINSNIKLPKEFTAKAKAGSYRTVVFFIVEKNGTVTNVKSEEKMGYGCDEEAVRVVKRMPKWKPGSQKGKPVRVKFFLPIRFDLAE